MNRTVSALLATTVVLASPIGEISNITIGAVTVALPNPSGFIPVTQRMTALSAFAQTFVSPLYTSLAVFIPEGDSIAALSGKIPDWTRHFAVQIDKENAAVSVSAADFGTLHDMVRSQAEALADSVNRAFPGLMSTLNAPLVTHHDVTRALTVSRFVNLPAHVVTDRMVSYSAFVNYHTVDAAGKHVPYVAALTTTFVLVKGKILCLYSYAEESGLAWTRNASKQWADEILASNVSDAGSSGNTPTPSVVTSSRWRNMDSADAFRALVIVCALLAIGPAILLERRRQRLCLGIKPYTWAYCLGVSSMLLGSALLIACLSTWQASYIAFGLGFFITYAVTGYFVVRRHRWAWVVLTILTLNPITWIINSIYGRNRWGELGTPTAPS